MQLPFFRRIQTTFQLITKPGFPMLHPGDSLGCYTSDKGAETLEDYTELMVIWRSTQGSERKKLQAPGADEVGPCASASRTPASSQPHCRSAYPPLRSYPAMEALPCMQRQGRGHMWPLPTLLHAELSALGRCKHDVFPPAGERRVCGQATRGCTARFTAATGQ